MSRALRPNKSVHATRDGRSGSVPQGGTCHALWSRVPEDWTSYTKNGLWYFVASYTE